MRTKLIITIGIFCLFYGGLDAQILENEVVNSLGSSSSNNGITVTASVGEAVIDQGPQNGVRLHAGFLQGAQSPTSLNALQTLGINVYPNPSIGTLFIEQLAPQRIRTIQIWDIYGRRLSTIPLQPFKTEIDLLGYPGGTYLLLFIGERGSQPLTYRLLLEK